MALGLNDGEFDCVLEICRKLCEYFQKFKKLLFFKFHYGQRIFVFQISLKFEPRSSKFTFTKIN